MTKLRFEFPQRDSDSAILRQTKPVISFGKFKLERAHYFSFNTIVIT